jgi:hypothetical protein
MAIKNSVADGPSAAEVAAQALGFLAADTERLGRFLALSGLDPSTIREAARDPAFLPAVLDHLLSDERLLIAFSQERGLPPESVARARQSLAYGSNAAFE